MTIDIINNSWMIIGTNNKFTKYISNKGRIKTGEKGIGRFSLDRLGEHCELYTKDIKSNNTLKWSVNWNDFENENATINDINADLEILNYDYSVIVNNIINKIDQELYNKCKDLFIHGTCIKIEGLRDNWSIEDYNRIFSNLEILTPPLEEDFNIYFYVSSYLDKYGPINSFVCDNYDYKLHAKVNSDGIIDITIYRNEFDINRINKNLFNISDMSNFPFDINTFEKGQYNITMKLIDLIPGVDESLVNNLGGFDFTFYYMKRSIDNDKTDKIDYYQKPFSSNVRSTWLNKFGAIKIYRDYFRVRPYGDINSNSFDWLNLGERKAQSPAAPSHMKGKWRVGPNQVSGTVNISRVYNIHFDDKSSREGIKETKEFTILKHILLKIISLIEEDRQTIMRSIYKLNQENNMEFYQKNKGKEIAKKIILKQKIENIKLKNNVEDEKYILAKTVTSYERDIEEKNIELKYLRVLASHGIAVNSLLHELSFIHKTLLPRTDDLEKSIINIIPANTLNTVPDYKNPIELLKYIKKDLNKIIYWLNFTLKGVKRDKRKLKKYNLFESFEQINDAWGNILTEKGISITYPISNNKKFYFKSFPIDVDTIFYNLIANSIDAFLRKDAFTTIKVRKINIELEELVLDKIKYMILYYEDTGPGLLNKIINPNQIFEPLFTTKKDNSGNDIGTGLGMWIVKSTILDYDGTIEITNPRPGFKVMIKIPISNEEGYQEDEKSNSN